MYYVLPNYVSFLHNRIIDGLEGMYYVLPITYNCMLPDKAEK